MPVDISLVICTRNRVASLSRAVDAALRVKTSIPWQLVIVDNGSSDGTNDFLVSLSKAVSNVELVTTFEAKRGLGAARNRGWRNAQGTIVAFTDDDCYVQADYIDATHSVFREHPGVGFVAGRVLLYDATDLRVSVVEAQEQKYLPASRFVAAGTIAGANLAFRRSTLERIGGFDEWFGPGTPFNCDDIDAVAAAVWSGIPGMYDPRPTVYHHHGRKSRADAKDLGRSYDWGRGAYYAKYILNRPSRAIYLRAWVHSALVQAQMAISGLFRFKCISPLKRARRELCAGLLYTCKRLLAAAGPHG